VRCWPRARPTRSAPTCGCSRLTSARSHEARRSTRAFERRLRRRNSLGGRFGRGAQPPSEHLTSARSHEARRSTRAFERRLRRRNSLGGGSEGGPSPPPSSMTLLELEDIHTYYGEAHILQGVSLAVKPGEVVTLIGRNGAGKTTTLRSIMGIVAPKRGS